MATRAMASWMPACASSVARTPSLCRPAMTISLPVTVSIAVMRMNISTTNSSTVISAAPRSRERGNPGTQNRDFLKNFQNSFIIFLTNSPKKVPCHRARSVARHRLAGQQDLLSWNRPALHNLSPLRFEGHGDHAARGRNFKTFNHRRNGIAAARRLAERIARLRKIADHPLQVVRPCGPGDTVADGPLPDRRVGTLGRDRLR